MIMKRQSLDTNIILRYVLNDIPKQTIVATKLLRKPGTRFFVSDIAFFEFVYILDGYYSFSRKVIRDTVLNLLQQKNIDCNRELIASTLEQFVAHNSLSFADCYLAASASFMNAVPLWTFDKTLAKQLPATKLL